MTILLLKTYLSLVLVQRSGNNYPLEKA